MQRRIINTPPKETRCLEGNGEIHYYTLVDGTGVRNLKANLFKK
jgi:hypothetical protein